MDADGEDSFELGLFLTDKDMFWGRLLSTEKQLSDLPENRGVLLHPVCALE